MLCSMARIAATSVCGVVLLAGACAAPPPRNDFSTPDTASRIESINTAARDVDRSNVRQIVEQLDSDDLVVRLEAISELKNLTGETNGYHYDDPPSLRNRAIERWVTYINRNYPDTTHADG
jgi:hypothetical protein